MQASNPGNRAPGFYRLYYAAIFAWLGTTAMHIPDGYLSPLTSAVMFFLVLPFWIRGIRALQKTATARNLPVVALVAAFSFVFMMFNVPLPGGTTGHAVGGALAAIILGPEIATLTISTALVLQAFFFGDGGILALGANCFNMAVVLPYASYSIYRAVARNQEAGSRIRAIAAGVGGWAGLTATAALAGFEFGIQPALFHTANGTPLYSPYPLTIAIPAMVVPHALAASVIEGVLTALVVAYLQKANPAVLELNQPSSLSRPAEPSRAHRWRKGWILLLALVAATPLGLLARGTAWGEWNAQELARRGVGFVPEGLARLNNLWTAPLGGYRLAGLGDSALGYLVSAFVGVALIVLLACSSGFLRARRNPDEQLDPISRSSQAVAPPRFRPQRASIIERNLSGLSASLEQAVFSERMAKRRGLFQSLDPRLKIIFTIAWAISAGLSHNIAVLGGLYAGVLFLAWVSKIPLGFLLKRVWLAMPFFTLGIALPAIFITPGPPLAVLPLGIVITQTGISTALFLILRVATSVSMAALLVMTTRWADLLNALAVLRVTDTALLVLGMTYRYIALFLHLANDVFLSRKSRMVSHLAGGEERRMIAASAGVLLAKSLHMSSEVYLAMQSRGFRAVPRRATPFQMKSHDWIMGGVLILITCAALTLGQ